MSVFGTPSIPKIGQYSGLMDFQILEYYGINSFFGVIGENVQNTPQKKSPNHVSFLDFIDP